VGYWTAEQLLTTLVSFDTVSKRSNMELVDFVQEYLAGFGVQSTLVPSDNGEKANLFATIGPKDRKGVILSGHTDVVSVDNQAWETDPFTVVRKNNRLFGRGTADMKSFIAIALSRVSAMQQVGLKKPIHFAFSYDEEDGCLGAPSMIREIAANFPLSQAVVVGEPSMMKVINAHKGLNRFVTKVTGYGGHSSQVDRNCSAVMTAARLVTFLEDTMEKNKQSALADSPFTPPYTTVHIGEINGGTSWNINARNCLFSWDLRNIPNDDVNDYIERFEAFCAPIIRKMKTVSEECEIKTTKLSSAPPLKPEQHSLAETLCKGLLGQNQTEVVSYGTEAGQFQAAGFSVVVCGPGSIDQAHQPNEYIELSQFDACKSFMDKLIAHLS
jgi:acetylornithine deacetylase